MTESAILSSFRLSTVPLPSPTLLRSTVRVPDGVANPLGSMCETVSFSAIAFANSVAGAGVNDSNRFCFLIV